MTISPLLGPIVALVAWSTLFRIWTAIRPLTPSEGAEQNLYRSALVEQPTRFYAIVFALILMHFDVPINVWIAWLYVGFRVARDLVEATFNHRRTRFFLFIGATIWLVALITHAALRLIHS